MMGLNILYASEAAKERNWEAVPNRDRTGRLREVYWAQRAESKLVRGSEIVTQHCQLDRTEIGRRSDKPGDVFVYIISSGGDQFEWVEVTEVFTTVPALQIEGAMRAWNGIPDKHPVDFNKFRRGLPLGRPSRVERRGAADRVIAQIERKLAKASYQELLEKYGYGTLVVGMPLWFAVPPDDPFRAENAIDDFMARTVLGLEDVMRRVLQRWDCPFRNVVVVWDTTPQALLEWRKGNSSEYGDAANASLENAMHVPLWGASLDKLENAISETETPESEVPSMSLSLYMKTNKMASGTGPYHKLVEGFREVRREENEHPVRRWLVLKSKVALTLFKLLCFLRLHGVKGLERWITRKLSVSHAWRRWAARRKARQLYQESRRRGRIFGACGHRYGVDGRGRGARVHSNAGQALGRGDA